MSTVAKTRSGGVRTGSGQAGYVDETLFGSTSPKLPNITRTTSSEKACSPMRTALRASGDVVTISERDLQRMLKGSPVLTAREVAAQKKAAEDKREAAQAVSKARKERMMKLEEEAKRAAPPTESEIIKRVADDATRMHADKLLEEEKDQVKKMNQMMLYSKCVTIRDAQVEEKRSMMQENDEENRRVDLMMEVDRIRALEQYEAREAARNEERRRGARVLEEQIAERERERIRQEELRELERIAMLRDIERLREEELQSQIEKKLRGKQLMEEVSHANQEQIRRKEMMKLREVEEDAKIQEYVKTKLKREEELQAERERIAHEKEMETARMRAKQEKANDKQAELDELRARRYQEAKEREWRARERAQIERATAMERELCEAREAQKNAALKQRADMAKVEHDDFVRVVAVNRQKEQEDMLTTIKKHEVNDKYKEDLLSQIQINEEKQKRARQEYLEEGARMRSDMEREKANIAAIKAQKLKELEAIGVPEKYRSELERMKINY